MAEENISPTPQAGAGDTAPQPQAGTPPSEPQAGGDEDQPISLAEAKKLRSEANSLRQRLKAAEGKAAELDKLKADIEDANLSEKDRLQKQYAELQKQHEDYTLATLERTINYEVRLQAAQMGIDPRYLDKVAKFVDWEDIQTDESGNLTNIKEVLEALIRDMPVLVSGNQRPAPTSGGPTNPPRSATQTTEITDAYIASLRPAQYESLSPEMKARISQYMQNRVSGRRR